MKAGSLILVCLMLAVGVTVVVVQVRAKPAGDPSDPATQPPATKNADQLAASSPSAAAPSVSSPSPTSPSVSPAGAPAGPVAFANPANAPMEAFTRWLGRPLAERWALDAPGATQADIPAWPDMGTIEYGFMARAPGLDQERRLTARVWFPADRTQPRVTFGSLSLGQDALAVACTITQEHGVLRWLDLPEGVAPDVAAQAQEAARWLMTLAAELPTGPVTAGQRFTLGGTPFCIARITATRIDAIGSPTGQAGETAEPPPASYPDGSGTYDDLSIILAEQGSLSRIERCTAHHSIRTEAGADATSNVRRLIVFPVQTAAGSAPQAAPAPSVP